MSDWLLEFKAKSSRRFLTFCVEFVDGAGGGFADLEFSEDTLKACLRRLLGYRAYILYRDKDTNVTHVARLISQEGVDFSDSAGGMFPREWHILDKETFEIAAVWNDSFVDVRGGIAYRISKWHGREALEELGQIVELPT